MKRLLALLLAALMLVSLAACGEKDDDKDTGKGESQTEAPAQTDEGLQLGLDNDGVKLGTPGKTLDPKSVYAAVKYDARFFHGDHRILGGEAGEKEYAKTVSYVNHDVSGIYADQITAVPYQLTAGKHTLNHKLNYVEGRNFLRAYFYTSNGNMTSNLCEYFVSGNTLTLKLIDKLEWNEDSTYVRCIMSNTSFTYTFSFEGTKLTLTNGTDTVELHSALSGSSDKPYLTLDNYLPLGAETLEGMDYLYALYSVDSEYSDDISRFSMENSEVNATNYGVALMEDNGLITITLNDEQTQSTKTFQMVYFYCKNDGMILTDGSKTYFFTQTNSDRRGDALGGGFSMEDANKLENLSAEKLAALLAKKADLLTDLAAAFEAAGLSVSINKESGEITMDASVLFPVDGYEVSEEGKELLKKFMSVYCSVVFDEKYAGFVSKIMVEGHTDSDGDYDYNLTLSQNRADSVKAFCLSADCGVDAYTAQLTEMLQAVGYSSDQLIRDASGNEDKAASRRVAFRFVINLDN